MHSYPDTSVLTPRTACSHFNRRLTGPVRGRRTVESATEHAAAAALHDTYNPDKPNPPPVNHAAILRLLDSTEASASADPRPIKFTNSGSTGGVSLVHSASANANGSASDRVFVESNRIGGGRGIRWGFELKLGFLGLLGIPGSCSQEKGTAEDDAER